MESSLFVNKRNLHAKTPITILTIISLILTVVCYVDVFTYYTYSNDGLRELHFSLFGYNIVDTIFSILSYLLAIAPTIIFAIYIFKFYKQFRAELSIPVVLGLIAFNPLFVVIRNLVLGYGFSSVLDMLVGLLIIVSFTLATISALKGLSKKIYIIVAIACGLLSDLVSFISFIGYTTEYIENGLYLYLFTLPLELLGSVALYIALLFFCLNNKMPVAIKKEKNTEKMTPEQSLKYLKEKLDLGMITEEEYQVQRAEIINKL
ncbi:MAG: hypothetical protein E7626_02290 [Ruminococcaceae bacterium]|nr:hypothetical protein [Oscillospiraceae bacterium]